MQKRKKPRQKLEKNILNEMVTDEMKPQTTCCGFPDDGRPVNELACTICGSVRRYFRATMRNNLQQTMNECSRNLESYAGNTLLLQNSRSQGETPEFRNFQISEENRVSVANQKTAEIDANIHCLFKENGESKTPISLSELKETSLLKYREGSESSMSHILASILAERRVVLDVAPGVSVVVGMKEPSIGSCWHSIGACKPCVFANKASKVCRNGELCLYCHHCHPREKRSRKKKGNDIEDDSVSSVDLKKNETEFNNLQDPFSNEGLPLILGSAEEKQSHRKNIDHLEFSSSGESEINFNSFPGQDFTNGLESWIDYLKDTSAKSETSFSHSGEDLSRQEMLNPFPYIGHFESYQDNVSQWTHSPNLASDAANSPGLLSEWPTPNSPDLPDPWQQNNNQQWSSFWPVPEEPQFPNYLEENQESLQSSFRATELKRQIANLSKESDVSTAQLIELCSEMLQLLSSRL